MENKIKSTIPVRAAPYPFRDQQIDFTVKPGTTIANIIGQAMPSGISDLVDMHVFVDDVLIAREHWMDCCPLVDQIVAINIVPAGGNGGKTALRIVASMVVIVAAAYSYGATLKALGPIWGAEAIAVAVSAAVGIAGQLAINALIPPALPDQPELGGGTGTSYAITGTRNVMTPYSPVQRLFGKHKIYPKLAARPWKIDSGMGDISPIWTNKDQFVTMLFCVGLGQYQLSDYKIGDTDLSSYSDYEIATGYKDDITSIHPDDVNQSILSIEILNSGGWYEQTTPANTEEIHVEVTFVTGLFIIDDDDGRIRGHEVELEAEYSIKDADSWTAFPESAMTVTKKEQHRFSVSFKKFDLTSNEYDVRVRRNTQDYPVGPGGSDGSVYICDTYLTAVNSITYGLPVELDECTLIALRIKASGQLHGVIDQFNCIAESSHDIWNGSAWVDGSYTRNPAWHFAEVLRSTRGDANKRPIADAKIDGDSIKAWADWMSGIGYGYDKIVENKTTVFKQLHEIAAAGRGSLTVKDGQFSVIYDDVQSTPRQHFSPRNSWDYKGSKIFNEMPHAIRCRFINEDSNYQWDEMIVPDDGYYPPTATATTWEASTAYAINVYVEPTTPNGFFYKCLAAGTSDSGEPTWPTTKEGTVVDNDITWYCTAVATRIDAMEFPGIVIPDNIFRMARYHIAVARLRPETHQINVDIEHLVCTRGDLVRLTHDVILVGLGAARIKVIAGSDLTIDDSMTMESGKTYAGQIRKADGTMLEVTITLDVGEQTVITVSSVTGVAVGDIIFFGESGSVSIDSLITRIDIGPDMTARLTLVDYAAGVYTADSGTIPDYDANITQSPEINRVPAIPNIESVTLVDGTESATSNNQVEALFAVINFSLGPTTDIEAAYFQIQYRSYDDNSSARYSNWAYGPDIDKNGRSVMIPVINGEVYDFRIRSVSEFGLTSDWDTYSDYTVTRRATVVPNDIVGLALIQGGSTWAGLDCEIEWTAPVDLYRVKKFKINVYKTSPLTLLRTVYIDADQINYSYTFEQNREDNAGSPIGGITFRVWAVSYIDNLSDTEAELAVTHTAPSAVTSLTAAGIMGGARFTWDDNTDEAFTHFLYRIQIEAAGWTGWLTQRSTEVWRILSSSERDTHGVDANIQIEVKAVDAFGTEGSAGATNQDAGSLLIEETDIDDFAITASKVFNKIPVVQGLTLTNNSPSAGYVAWNAHTLYYNGVEYSIAAGNTDLFYIYWKDLAAVYAGSDDHPADDLGTWQPGEDFIIAINDSGSAQEAWNAIANQVVGSSYIMDAAIQTAHVDTINGNRITTNTLTATQINGAGLGTLTITSGKIAINTTDALEIQASGNVLVKQGGDIILEGGSTGNPSLIRLLDGIVPGELRFEDDGTSSRYFSMHKKEVAASIHYLQLGPSGSWFSGIDLGRTDLYGDSADYMNLYTTDAISLYVGSTSIASLYLTATNCRFTKSLEIDLASGDPIIIFDTNGANRFTIGVDDSDGDAFKIQSGGSLGSAFDFKVAADGHCYTGSDLVVGGDNFDLGSSGYNIASYAGGNLYIKSGGSIIFQLPTGTTRFNFYSDGTATADVAWNTFCPEYNIRENTKSVLDHALEDVKKPHKPYDGIVGTKEEIDMYGRDALKIAMGSALVLERIVNYLANNNINLDDFMENES